MAMPPFRAPRVPRALGQTSPLAIALSSVGAGLQGYSRDKEATRLNEAETYRRKMEEMKTARAEALLAEQKAEQAKTRSRNVQALRGTRPARLGRTFSQQEAEAIADGVLNPSDLYPNAPQGGASSATANTRRQQTIDAGMTAIRMMSGGGGDYTPGERESFWTAFNLAIGGSESDLSAEERAVVANNVFNQWKKNVDTARAQRAATRRRNLVTPSDGSSTPVQRQVQPRNQPADSATTARLNRVIQQLEP